MQMSNGYRDAMNNKTRQCLDSEYERGFAAGSIDLDLFREFNQDKAQESFRYSFTRLLAQLRNAGICYVHIAPDKRVICKTKETELEEFTTLVGVYTHKPCFADFKDDLIETMLEIYNVDD